MISKPFSFFFLLYLIDFLQCFRFLPQSRCKLQQKYHKAMESVGSVVHSEVLVIYLLSLLARALNLACGLQLLGCVPMGVIVPIRRNVIGDYLAGNAV